MTTLSEEKFAPLFGDWWIKIKPFFLSGGFDEIYEFLKKEARRGKLIAPLSENVYRAFTETSYKDVCVVIVGYCPYHSFVEGKPVADGLAFSCGVTNRLQPSLTSWYEGIEHDVYNGLAVHKQPDLSFLARQGVMLLNSSLTVEKNKPGSHQDLWHPFMKYLMEEVFSYTGIPIVFVGKDAEFYERYTMPITHGPVFKIEHPSFAARNFTTWDTQGVFTKLNKYLKQVNNIEIKWIEDYDNKS